MGKPAARTEQRNLASSGGYEFLCLELLGSPGMLFVRFVLLRDVLGSYPCCFFVQFEHLSAVLVTGWLIGIKRGRSRSPPMAHFLAGID